MSKLPKLTEEEISALSHDQLADALMARGVAKEDVPAKKVDRIAALKLYEPEADNDGEDELSPEELLAKEEERRAAMTQEEREAEDMEKIRRANLTQDQRDAEDAAEGKKQAPQNGTGKKIEAKSTKPAPTPNTKRPYLDSPRAFGIHISGKKGDTHLVRFQKGRTSINDAFAEGFVGLDAADILKALKTDSYVADNGAEVVE